MISAFNPFATPRSHSRRPYDQAVPHKWAYLIEQEAPREKSLFGYRAIEDWLRTLAAKTLLQSSGLAS